MKGPGMRIELDVSRIWRCPACGRTVGTRGTETARRCFCSGTETWMDLVEPIRRPRDFSEVISVIHQGLESDGTSQAEPSSAPENPVSAQESPAEGSASPASPGGETPAEAATVDSFGAGVSPEEPAAASSAAPQQSRPVPGAQADEPQAERSGNSADDNNPAADETPPAETSP